MVKNVTNDELKTACNETARMIDENLGPLIDDLSKSRIDHIEEPYRVIHDLTIAAETILILQKWVVAQAQLQEATAFLDATNR